ncbi:MAG: hypothetical protein ACRC33_15585, partial [Gemmataceae bacterium]
MNCSPILLLAFAFADAPPKAPTLLAGVARVDITDRKVLSGANPLSVKALVLKSGDATAVLITVDAVAIGEIGPIGNGYLGTVRARLLKDLKIAPASVLVNASHCHGRVCAEVEDRTVEAVTKAAAGLVPVTVGVGVGEEKRISENRRLRMKDGKEIDVRHAYSLPPDAEVAEVGPIDPRIGLLRLDRAGGRPLAVVYHFACHPIMGLPSGEDTADLVGFASAAVEDGLGDGAVALFLQGCGGDINPVRYKDVHQPRDCEPLGNLLGLSVLRAARKVKPGGDATLKVVSETIPLPRADNTRRIDALLLEQGRLLKSLQGTTLNLRTFLELTAKHGLSPAAPSAYAQAYLNERKLGRDDLKKLDEANRENVKRYLANVHTMEQLT